MRALLTSFTILALAFSTAQCKPSHSRGRVVCYYNAGAVYRPGEGSYGIDDIPLGLCTHMIYAFVGVTGDTHEISVLDPELDVIKGNFKKFTALKSKDPNVKFMVSIGGWGEGGAKYSAMVSNPSYREVFVKSVVDFLIKYCFDGFDLDWEYPGATDRDGTATDKDNFLYLVQELRAAFNKVGKNWELTASVPLTQYRLSNGYRVPELCEALDAVHAMSYDLRGSWDGMTDVHSPLCGRPDDIPDYKNVNVVGGLALWENNGCPANKLVVGVPFYARTFTLNEGTTSFLPGTPTNKTAGGGKAGPFTGESGILSYYEVCSVVDAKDSTWTKQWAQYGKCPYAYSTDNQWVGYENTKSIDIKMNWLKKKGYLGAMTWAIDLDDFRGMCGEKSPLLKTLHKHMSKYTVPKPKKVSSTVTDSACLKILYENNV